jgi:glycosyltransferase involved in cell wall biosynthesis
MDRMSDGPRILFVTADEFPTHRPDVDALFGKELRKLGYGIDWIACGPAATSGSIETTWRGCRVWLAPSARRPGPLGRLRSLFLALRNESRMFRLLRSQNYDFLQIKDLYLTAVLGIIAARWSGTRFFYWHSFPFPEASQLQASTPGSRHPCLYALRARLQGFLLYRVICPQADHVFVQSEEMKRQMAARGVPADRMTAVPMGVDDDVFRFCGERTEDADTHEPQPRGAGTALRLVYLGALDRIRRLDFLVEVLARVRRQHGDASLWFVGDGHDPADRDVLRGAARRLGVEAHVHITGFLPRELALRHVAGASIGVSSLPPGPVFDVSSPTKALEYLALSRPVVANDIPDTRSVLEASGGGLSVPYDVAAFADAVCWLANHPSDALRMGRRGRQYVRAHRSYRALAQQLDRQYAMLLGREPSAVTTGG